MIKPSVGRKVWYRPSKADQTGPVPMVAGPGQPLDATIIAVWGDRSVNLNVVDTVGRSFPVLSCTLLQDDDMPSTDEAGDIIGRYAEWMPFQTAQAAKDAAPGA